MSLPEALEQEFWRELQNFQEEQRMPYITSVERIGFQRGLEQGLEQMRQVLKEGIELVLEMKFGSSGLNLLPEISEIQDIDQLRTIHAALKTVNSVEELRQIYTS